MSQELFDDEFLEDAMGVAALLVAGAVGIAFGVAVVISAFNWIEFIKGLVQ